MYSLNTNLDIIFFIWEKKVQIVGGQENLKAGKKNLDIEQSKQNPYETN